VAGEVLDDIELARVWRAAGRSVHLYGGAGVATFRMYPGGLRHLIEGWTKNFGAGARAIRPVTAVLVALWLSVPLEALWWVVRLAIPGHHAGGVAAAAGLYAVAAVQLWWMLRRVGSFGLITAAAFPIPLVVFVAVFLRSLVASVTRRPVRWKGRRVPTGRRSAPLPPGP
jgi:4,4'-diaponeurosporenoate glycosyltransferase